MSNVKIPSDGAKITINKDGTYDIPDNPIITFIEGDGIGPDLWRASVRAVSYTHLTLPTIYSV